MGPLMIVLGLAMTIGGIAGTSFNLSPLAGAIISGVGVIVLVLGMVVWAMAFYQRSSADMAFVRTGAKGTKVVLDGGTVVLPFFHRKIDINLRTMKLGVNPRGVNALITRDNLRADVLAQFYIRVQADTEHILNAARSLGESSVDENAVEALVSEKLTSALRAIASQMDLVQIHTQRDQFAERVKEHVKDDLEANGLLLESVTISELDQTDPKELSDNNVFDAQGKRKITEITSMALVERNNLDREAERNRKVKDVETRQRILELERMQAEAEAGQEMEVAKIRAERDREAKEAVITQERLIELARIGKEKAIQEQEIARHQAVETARAGQEKAVQTAQIERDTQVQTAQVQREQSVALAERQKQIAVAEQEAARAKAEESALKATAERERAGQEVTTVTQLAEADREANKKLIAARQEIEQGKLRQQTAADVEAYTQIKQADAEREAAAQQAAARKQIAEAEAQAREMVARGEKAQQMVAVEVAREQVNVEQAKVDVERQQLQNRQEFAQAGIQLEVQRLSIQADRDVQMEFARAMAGFLSNGRMTLYGTPETATQMMDNMAKGFGIRSMIEGFVNGADGSASNGHAGNGHAAGNGKTDVVGNLIGQLGGLLQPAIAKVTNGSTTEMTPEQAQKVAQSLADNPAFLSALQDAIKPTQTTVVVEPEVVSVVPVERTATKSGKG